MKSSFIRKGATAPREPGTRPGLHGNTLVSMGLVDLDKLFEGGLPLGTVLLIIQRTKVLMSNLPTDGIGSMIPAVSAPRSTQEAVADTADTAEPELRIAWQYRKYIQQNANNGMGPSTSSPITTRSRTATSQSAVQSGLALQWCHALDLTKSLGAEEVKACGTQALGLAGPGCWDRVQDEALAFIQEFPPPAPNTIAGPRGPESVGRLVIQDLGGPAWGEPPGASAAAIVRLVLAIRQAAQDSRCAVMITCPAGLLPASHAMRLQHICDAVLTLQSVADDSDVTRLLPDPASVSALLSVVKLPSAGMVGPRLPDIPIYVIRHKRRRLVIQAIDIDPDAEAAAAEGGGAASMLCAGPPKATSPLDF